ncbi:PaaI family thioesterase [Gordonia sp. NPDC003376]
MTATYRVDAAARGRFDEDIAVMTDIAGIRTVGPTCAPDELFGVRLLGQVPGGVAADCLTPPGEANPGWLMPMVDLLLARATVTNGAGCVTSRIDLDVDPGALAGSDLVRGVGRSALAHGVLGTSTCEIRSTTGVLVGTGMGTFVLDSGGVPDPYASTGNGEVSHVPSLTGLLGIELDTDSGTGTLEVVPQHMNPSGVVHGGVQAAILCAAVEALIVARIGTGRALTHVAVEYLRALPADAGPLTISVRPRRIGRTLAFIDAELGVGPAEPGTRLSAVLHTTSPEPR